MGNRQLVRHHSSPAAIHAVDDSPPNWNDQRQNLLYPRYVHSTISSPHYVVPVYRTYSSSYSIASMYNTRLYSGGFVSTHNPYNQMLLRPSIEYVRENASNDQLRDCHQELGEQPRLDHGIGERVPRLSNNFRFPDPDALYPNDVQFRNNVNGTERSLYARPNLTYLPTNPLHQSVVNAAINDSTEGYPAAPRELECPKTQNSSGEEAPGMSSQYRDRFLDLPLAPTYRAYMRNNHFYHSYYLPRFLPFYTIFPGIKPYRVMPLKVPVVEGLENSLIVEPQSPQKNTMQASSSRNSETRTDNMPSEQGQNSNDVCEDEDVLEFRKSCLADPIVEISISRFQPNRYGSIGEKRK